MCLELTVNVTYVHAILGGLQSACTVLLSFQALPYSWRLTRHFPDDLGPGSRVPPGGWPVREHSTVRVQLSSWVFSTLGDVPRQSDRIASGSSSGARTRRGIFTLMFTACRTLRRFTGAWLPPVVPFYTESEAFVTNSSPSGPSFYFSRAFDPGGQTPTIPA